MPKGDLIQLDEWTELIKITADKYRYVNSGYAKITAKLSDHNTDVKMKVGNEYFKAHKDVLSTASDYFSAMFSHDMMEKGKDFVELHGISLGGFRVMLEYFYHGHITLLNENVEHCLEASRYFHVEWLTKACCNFLTRHLSVSNCLYILSLADKFSLSDLSNEMYSFIGTNALKLVEEEKVPHLSYEVLMKLLSTDCFIDLTEELVLKMIVDWVNAEYEERKINMKPLLSTIKFHLMNREELDNIPAALLNYNCVALSVEKAMKLWDNPHCWSIEDEIDLSARGAREVLLLLSQWDSDRMQCVDLKHSYLHQELFGLFSMDSVVDFTSIAELGNFLYAAGGYNKKLQPISSLYMFDPRLRIWFTLCPMMYCRENFPLVSTGDKLYAIGGATLTSLESVVVSNTNTTAETDQEEKYSAVSGNVSGNEEQSSRIDKASGLQEPSATPSTICLRNCESYDPATDCWSRIPLFPYGIYAHSACYCDGTIYVSGGVTDNLSDSVPVRFCYSYTPGDDSWNRIAPMITRRQSHAMFAHDGKIYAMGGYTAGDLEDATLEMVNCLKNECYDPKINRWTELPETPQEFGHIHKDVAVIDHVAYLLGGCYSSKYLHEYNLKSQELIEGAYCGNDYIKLTRLKVAYPKHIPSDVLVTEESHTIVKSGEP